MPERNLTDADVEALAKAINAPRPSVNEQANEDIRSKRGQTMHARKQTRLQEALTARMDTAAERARTERSEAPSMRVDEEAEAGSPALKQARQAAERARAEQDA